MTDRTSWSNDAAPVPDLRPAPELSESAVPVDEALPRLRESLRRHTRCILEAPAGAGKTTRVPLALLAGEDEDGWLKGRNILMLEPRRMAARNAARYMAGLLGEPVGRSVGYEVRLERRPGARVNIVTEGILTRRLQEDPELREVGCLVFDEFHERNLNADLGLALALDCQEALRPDLRILVMSATLEAAPLQRLLGGEVSSDTGTKSCPLIRSEGRAWPVATRYLPLPRPATSRSCAGGVPFSARHVADAVRRALAEESGSILVFLPGSGEIRRVQALLEDLPARGVRVRPLYGDLAPGEQDAAIATARSRKVVLATAIAETSLTIEGIGVVIDAGLARSVRFDPGSGMERLVTGRVSLAGAEQRRGRAGRLGPGVCYRLWDAGEEAGFRPGRTPEILETDLASLCLELAVWGVKDASALRWLDEPPAEALTRGRRLLRALGALDAAGMATARGRAMAALPLHPRLAHMVLEGRTRGLGPAACLMAALLEERDPLRVAGAGSGSGWPGVDVRRRLALLYGGEVPESGPDARGAGGIVRRIREAAAQIARRVGVAERDLRNTDEAVEQSGLLLALAYPDRVAGRRGRGTFRMANGRGAALPEGDPLAGEALLAIGGLSDELGDARIFAAAPLSRDTLETLYGGELTREDRIVWDPRDEGIVARRERRFGALVLEAETLAPVPEAACRAAVCAGIRTLGLACLPWTPELETWRWRVAFMRGLEGGKVWPDLSEACLLHTLEVWLQPFLERVTRRAHFRTIDLSAALQSLLPWELRRRLDREAPTHLEVPSGSRVRLDYSGCAAGPAGDGTPASPVLAVKLQELFGLTATPAIASGRAPVLVHLLSPAGRPVQITKDLAGFWKNGYPAVRAEMRGRYPRHPWPEDPFQAVPTRRVMPRP